MQEEEKKKARREEKGDNGISKKRTEINVFDLKRLKRFYQRT